MMRKALISISLLFYFCIEANGQCDTRIYDSLVSLVSNSKKWTAIQMNGIVTLKYQGKFTTNTIQNPRQITKSEINNPDSSSLFISFSFHGEWNDSLYNSVSDSNRVYLEKLTREYIHQFDSVGWPSKHSKEIFLENPMKYLSKVEVKDVCTFVKVRALPDFRIGSCGISYGCVIDFSTHYIVEEEERKEIELMFERIRKLDPNIKIGLEKITNY